MDRSLDVGHVSDALPSLGQALEDPRLRPFGLVFGFSLLAIGSGLSIAPTTGQWAFWSNAVASTLVFVSVPLFCLGLAASEPSSDSVFHIGVDFSTKQRHAVAVGALCLVLAPVVMAIGLSLGLWMMVLATAATMAFVGSALMLTGFVAWTAETIAQPTSA